MIAKQLGKWLRFTFLILIGAMLSSCLGSSVTFTTDITLSSISVTSASQTVAANGTNQMTATGTYSDGSTKDISPIVAWSSDKPAIATVNSGGLVTGVAAGAANITATMGTISGANVATVTTTATPPANATLTSIAITSATASVSVGGTSQLTATGNYSDGSTANITSSVAWTSSAASTATVSTAGLVTGVATGSATLNASKGGIASNTATITVTVTKLVGGTIQGAPLNLTPQVSTFAGTATHGFVNGAGTAASFYYPTGITTDGANLYVVDRGNHAIRKIVITTGVVSTVAVASMLGTLYYSTSITTDGANLYVTDVNNNAIRQIVIATGVVGTLAGSGGQGFVNGTGTAASFYYPSGITTDGANLYVADINNQAIRKIVIATGAVSTVATGTGSPADITTDGVNLYVTDWSSPVIRKIVIATGAVSIMGTGYSFGGITSDGINLYAADYNNNAIRKIQ